METASANPVWAGPIVTGVWWDTGVSMTTAAGRVTVPETVTPSPETACLGTTERLILS